MAEVSTPEKKKALSVFRYWYLGLCAGFAGVALFLPPILISRRYLSS